MKAITTPKTILVECASAAEFVAVSKHALQTAIGNLWLETAGSASVPIKFTILSASK